MSDDRTFVIVGAGLAGAKDSNRYFQLPVPADATNVHFNLSGGTGDADLFVSFGVDPTIYVDGIQYTGSITDAAAFAAFIKDPKAAVYNVKGLLAEEIFYTSPDYLAAFKRPPSPAPLPPKPKLSVPSRCR